MKQKIVLALFMAMVAMNAKAQNGWSITPRAGLNIATIGGEGGEGAASKIGLTIGGEAEYRMNNVGYSVGLFYSQEGASEKDSKTDEKLNLHYLNVPVLVNLHLLEGLSLKMGLQPSLLLAANISASQGSISGSVNISKNIKDLGLSIPVGLSYEYKNVMLDVRYNFGLLSIISDKDIYVGDTKFTTDDRHTTTNVLQITLGYRFHL